MKKCLVCQKNLEKEEKDFCDACRTFFEWKYRRISYPLRRIRKYFSNAIKLGRLK